MDFELSEEIKAIQEMAGKFTQNEIAPRVAEDEENHTFQRDIINKMGELGFFGCPIPEEYGGLGAGASDIAIISERMAKMDLAVATSFLAICLGMDPISTLISSFFLLHLLCDEDLYVIS